LRSKSGNPETRVFDYFNIVIGISIRGVFVIMLFATHDGECILLLCPPPCCLMGSCAECSKATATTEGSRCTMEAMERVIREALGDRLTLHNTVKPVLIPCYDLQSFFSLIFSRANALESESIDF
ncbi:unnamed protein product, partial [Musa hybrid cultivar]